MTVALVEGAPVASGRTWTAEDYAKRDAAMAALGITLRQAAHRSNDDNQFDAQA